MANLLVGSVRVVLKEADERVAKMLIVALAVEFRQLTEVALWTKRTRRRVRSGPAIGVTREGAACSETPTGGDR